ncbi:helix-turn-helix domain-containing protein [Nocardioides okcheonensis]|uniref:helix-turn-helix domain-containing protein n=1 Tax=Nocardioides okcheonensis TaxID=2894081 RepID=UPI001E63F509|nr:helix-turn-helix transcriptional regulator [Nocardioides okcheonensis]UFN46015.1 helix-turn-helix transcriptional regulator [Nocardioides okcheonensis]
MARRTAEDAEEQHGVTVHLDEVLAARGMTLTELAERVGVTVVNLSVLKNGRAKAVRFSTLTRVCRVLDCQPGDILRVEPGGD